MGDRLAQYRRPEGQYSVPSVDALQRKERDERTAARGKRGEYPDATERKAARMRRMAMTDFHKAMSWGQEAGEKGAAQVTGRSVNALELHRSDAEPTASWKPDEAQNYDRSLSRLEKAPPIGVVKKILRDDREAKRTASEAGTTEGAIKGWETRRSGGGGGTEGGDAGKALPKGTLGAMRPVAGVNESVYSGRAKVRG